MGVENEVEIAACNTCELMMTSAENDDRSRDREHSRNERSECIEIDETNTMLMHNATCESIS